MKSRQHFEGELHAKMQERLAAANNPKDEAMWLIDLFAWASFMCAFKIEPGISTKPAMNRIFARHERIREKLESDMKKHSKSAEVANQLGKPDGGVDGNPIVLPPGYDGN